MIINPDKCSYMCLGKNNKIDDTLSIIRQKNKPQNGGFKKTKHAKFSEKQAFLTP